MHEFVWVERWCIKMHKAKGWRHVAEMWHAIDTSPQHMHPPVWDVEGQAQLVWLRVTPDVVPFLQIGFGLVLCSMHGARVRGDHC
jgi:hypothetical protein